MTKIKPNKQKYIKVLCPECGRKGEMREDLLPQPNKQKKILMKKKFFDEWFDEWFGGVREYANVLMKKPKTTNQEENRSYFAHEGSPALNPLKPKELKQAWLNNKQEAWEEELTPLLSALYYEAIKDDDNDTEELPIRQKLASPIKQFIRQLLIQEREKLFTDNGANSMCEYWYQKGKKEEREGVIDDIKFFFCHKRNSPQEKINNLMKWLNIKEEDLPKL